MDTVGLAFGNLWMTVHMLRVLVDWGVFSPEDIEQIYGSLIEGVQGGDPNVAAMVETRLQTVFAEFQIRAAQTWQGANEEGHS